jgi:hypothetical protein
MALIAVAGSVAQRPGRGGHAWVFLNYVLGLRLLGHEVFFIDRLTAAMHGRTASDAQPGPSPEERWFADVVDRMGVRNSHILLGDGQESISGMSREQACERLSGAALLINVNGFLQDSELLDAFRTRAFLDIDPGFLQMWEDLGLATLFEGHDVFFTVGENLGTAGCEIPTCGREWVATKQPVVLSEWPAADRGEAFTTVASWRGPYGPIDYGGETYGLRVHELRRFADLPSRVDTEFELALDIDPSDARDADALRRGGWRLLDPFDVAGDPDRYRAFVRRSMAEVCVAKNTYVRSRSGWFSDRSACYLASGKPVLAQDTGLDGHLPLGEGLVCFSDPDEAAAGARAVCADWDAHSLAARRIAEEHFDSRKVLGDMLAVAGV